MGYLVNPIGYSPDPDRLHPILPAEEPKNHNQSRSIIGCFQYYARFIPDSVKIAEPLFALQTSQFNWQAQHRKALIQSKEILASGPALRSFSASITPVLITDASPDGLGAVLEQEGRPVICVSRRSSKAERGYSQTQKEASTWYIMECQEVT